MWLQQLESSLDTAMEQLLVIEEERKYDSYSGTDPKYKNPSR